MEQRLGAMEGVVTGSRLSATYLGRRVLVTGHTGFKGSWLCEWLLAMGATVRGLSLPPPTQPSVFEQLGLANRLDGHIIGDVRDPETAAAAIREFQPDFVFHLAAQPLVRASYQIPVETFQTNVIGTCLVLDAVRRSGKACSVVVATTDKCYQNLGQARPFTESDRLGGHDPYSASKAAAELVVASYRDSYFSSASSEVHVASARAGNVIGGGDWSEDRIVPDAVRALAANRPIPVRNPGSVRPWQHVLEPLAGYLVLGAMLPERAELRSAFNFGPLEQNQRTVQDLVEGILQIWPGSWVNESPAGAPHEAAHLMLSTQKAEELLSWKPVWTFDETIRETVAWYRQPAAEAGPFTREQITRFTKAAAAQGLSWAQPNF